MENTTPASRIKPAIIRFLEKVQVSASYFYEHSPCWEWHGCLHSNGYGSFAIETSRHNAGKARTSSPHIFAYEYFIGPRTPGMQVHHLCYNRKCCSPFHLELRTPRDNSLDEGSSTISAVHSRKTHCVKGHPLTKANLCKSNRGRRKCRECNLEHNRQYMRRPEVLARVKARRDQVKTPTMKMRIVELNRALIDARSEIDELKREIALLRREKLENSTTRP